MTQLIDQRAEEARRSAPRSSEWLLLPRPWLTSDTLRHRGNRLYVSGTVSLNGEVIQLPYWHRVVHVRRAPVV